MGGGGISTSVGTRTPDVEPVSSFIAVSRDRGCSTVLNIVWARVGQPFWPVQLRFLDYTSDAFPQQKETPGSTVYEAAWAPN
jgi:hypothetical protein